MTETTIHGKADRQLSFTAVGERAFRRLQQLREERHRLQRRIEVLDGAIAALETVIEDKPTPRPPFEELASLRFGSAECRHDFDEPKACNEPPPLAGVSHADPIDPPALNEPIQRRTRTV